MSNETIEYGQNIIKIESPFIYKVYARMSSGFPVLVASLPNMVTAERARDDFVTKHQFNQRWVNKETGIVETEIKEVDLRKGSNE